LALFGLGVMLCYTEAKSAKHRDNFLSHCIYGCMSKNAGGCCTYV
jgi:hypothetical protein